MRELDTSITPLPVTRMAFSASSTSGRDPIATNRPEIVIACACLTHRLGPTDCIAMKSHWASTSVSIIVVLVIDSVIASGWTVHSVTSPVPMPQLELPSAGASSKCTPSRGLPSSPPSPVAVTVAGR